MGISPEHGTLYEGRTTTDWVLAGGTVLLIAWVSLLPYRFLTFDQPLGSLVNYLPLLLTITLACVLLLNQPGVVLMLMRRDVLLAAITALFVSDLLGAIGGVNGSHSLLRTVYYFLTGPLIYWVVRCACRGVGQPRLLLITVSASAGLAALYGISEYAIGRNWMFESALSVANLKFVGATGGAEFSGRILGTVGHPVAFGAFLLLSLPSSLHLTFERSRARTIGISSAAAAFVAIALTFSRGAWVAVAVAAAVFVTRIPRHCFRRIAVSRALVLGVLLVVVVSAILVTRGTYSEFIQHYDENPRLQAYSHTATLLPRHLMLGSGVGTFRWMGKALGSRLDTLDNMYLTRLTEGGILGLATLIYLFSRIYRNLAATSVEHHGEEPWDRAFPRWSLAVLLGVGVDMMTFDLLYWPATRSLFWLQVALAMEACPEQG